MDYDRLLDNLKHRGFLPQLLPNAAAARQAALDILGTRSVGFGGSATVRQLGLYEALQARGNQVWWHWHAPKEDKIPVERAAQAAEALRDGAEQQRQTEEAARLTAGRTLAVGATEPSEMAASLEEGDVYIYCPTMA